MVEQHIRSALKKLEEPEKLNIASIHLLYLHDLSKAVDLSYAQVRQSLTPTSDHPYEMEVQMTLSPGAIKQYLASLSIYLRAILRSKDFRPYLSPLMRCWAELEEMHKRTEEGAPLGNTEFYAAEKINLEVDGIVRDIGSFSSFHRVPIKSRAQRPQEPGKEEEDG